MPIAFKNVTVFMLQTFWIVISEYLYLTNTVLGAASKSCYIWFLGWGQLVYNFVVNERLRAN